MTTVFFFVRHAAHGLLDRVLVGRMDKVSLSDEGRMQAERLARYFAGEPVTAIQSSPLERAVETAQPIAQQCGLSLQITPALDEIDCGAWSGRSFDELETDADWRKWNRQRANARAPDGESMREVQRRVLDHLQAVSARHPEGRVVLVSHSDVIKSALLHFLGLSLDAYARIEIAPASVSTVAIGGWGCKVIALNSAAPS